MPAVSIKITGNVQGVYFRGSARDKADTLGIVGFVQNQNDGSVYIEAEGSSADLSAFIIWCKIGPPRAQVMTFVIEDQPEKEYVGFEIRR
jgi:acylphosphatase